MNIYLHGIGGGRLSNVILITGMTEKRQSASGLSGYNDLVKRDTSSLDIFWLKDESLEDTDNLPDPATLAREIVESLETALEQFRGIDDELVEGK